MQNKYQFYLGWQAQHVATLSYDEKWAFDYEDGWLLPMTLATNVRPRAIPPSIMSMMPEGFAAESRMGSLDVSLLETLQRSERLMSNVVVVDDPARIAAAMVDRLHGRLRDFTVDGAYCGKMAGVPRIIGPFVDQLRELVSRRMMPLMSGYHAKIPMFLSDEGDLMPAERMPFTHILKLPGVNGDLEYRRSVIEWACLDIARGGGLRTAECALVELQDDKIGMLSERFDVCTDADDLRMLLAEELHAVMGKKSGAMQKFESSTDKIATRLSEVSTNFYEDSRELLRLVCANLLLENGDFHLKNLSVLKVAEPTLTKFRTVRLAPAYDIMNTRLFSAHPKPLRDDQVENIILPINGKVNDISARDLVALAKHMGIDPDEAREIMVDLASGMVRRAAELHQAPPALIARQDAMVGAIKWTCERLARRVGDIFPEVDCSLDLGDEAEIQRTHRLRP